MEIRVLDAVPVDLADVEVGGDFGDVLGWDAVGGAADGEGGEVGFLFGAVGRLRFADLFWGKRWGWIRACNEWKSKRGREDGEGAYPLHEVLVVGLFDERDDSAWGGGCAAVVLAFWSV